MAVAVTFQKRVPPGVTRSTLAELMARQKAAADAASSAQSMETPTIMQGLGKLGMIGANVWNERKNAKAESAGREELARIRAGIGAEGATPEQEAQAGLIDPEFANQLRQERLAYAEQLAERQQAVEDREDTQKATADLQTSSQTFQGGQNDLTRGVTVSEGAAGRTVQTTEGQADREAAADLQGNRLRAEADAAKLAEMRLRARPGTPGAEVLDAYSRDQFGPQGSPEAMKRRDEEWAKVTAIPGPSTVVNTGAEGSGDLWKKFNTDTGANFAGYMKDSVNAGNQMRGLEILDQIDPAAQGPLVGRLAEMFPGVSSQAAFFESVVKRMAPQERVEGSGSQSDLEYKGLLSSWPQLKNMPGVNKAISQAIREQAKIAQERAAIIVEMYGKPFDDPATQAGMRKLLELDQRSILSPELASTIQAIQADQPIPSITITEGDAEGQAIIDKYKKKPAL